MKLASLKLMGEGAGQAFLRFPSVIICAAAATFLSIALVDNGSGMTELVRLLFTFALGIPLFLATYLFLEKPAFRVPFPLAWRVAPWGFLLAWYFLSLHDLTFNYYVLYFQLSLSFHLMVAFVPFLRPGETNGFWQFNRRLFLRICLSVLYSAVLFLGLTLAIQGANHLFDLKLKEDIFFKLWLFAVFLFQTWHFIGGIPRPISRLEASKDYPDGLRIFAQYMLVPLLAVYGIILYAYMGKVLATWDWPRGLVSWLVSAMSIFGIFTLLLLYPYRVRRQHAWVGTLARGFFIGILPLLLMLYTALGKRIQEYGVTENRYALAVLGAWLAGIALFFVVDGFKRVKVIPVSLCCLVLACSVGPWSGFAVSRRSQTARLEALLKKVGMLAGGRIVKAPADVDREARAEISGISDYLVQHHGHDSLKRWVDSEKLWPRSKRHGREEDGFWGVTDDTGEVFVESLGLEYLNSRQKGREQNSASFWVSFQEGPAPVKGFEWMSKFSLETKPASATSDGSRYHVVLDPKRQAIQVWLDSSLLGEAGLRDVLDASLKYRDEKEGRSALPSSMGKLEIVGKGSRYTILFSSLKGSQKDSSLTANGGSGTILGTGPLRPVGAANR